MGIWNGLAWFLIPGTPVSRTAIVWHLSTVGPVILPTGVLFAAPGIILVGIGLVLRGFAHSDDFIGSPPAAGPCLPGLCL